MQRCKCHPEGARRTESQGPYQAYSEPGFIEALRETDRIEVIRTSSEVWPDGGSCPMSVAVRVHMALDSGKAVLIEKDGAYRYYLVGKAPKAPQRRT